MQEQAGDLWTYLPADARCITTNGVVAGDILKGTRHAVMGRGVAQQAAMRYPGLADYFGMKLDERGNVPIILMNLREPGPGDLGPVLVSFPVKQHWRQRADLALISDSARLLIALADKKGWRHVVLPRPGCGNGNRDWVGEVRPLLWDVLDDRFTVVNR